MLLKGQILNSIYKLQIANTFKGNQSYEDDCYTIWLRYLIVIQFDWGIWL